MHDLASNPFQVWSDLEKTKDIFRFQTIALHFANQYNTGIPVLKTQHTAYIEVYKGPSSQFKSEEEHKFRPQLR